MKEIIIQLQNLERERNEFKARAENSENDLEMFKKAFDALSFIIFLMFIIFSLIKDD